MTPYLLEFVLRLVLVLEEESWRAHRDSQSESMLLQKTGAKVIPSYPPEQRQSVKLCSPKNDRMLARQRRLGQFPLQPGQGLKDSVTVSWILFFNTFSNKLIECTWLITHTSLLAFVSDSRMSFFSNILILRHFVPLSILHSWDRVPQVCERDIHHWLFIGFH